MPPFDPNSSSLLQQKLDALYAQQRKDRQTLADALKVIDELKATMRQSTDAPTLISQIPGKRVPYMAAIDITISASSTTRAEGTFPISQDGPFVCTGAAMFWRRTSGAYTGWWGPATTVGMKIAPATQQAGFDTLFDNPIVHSFNVELTDTASDRQWQNQAFASALFNPENGYMFMWPVQYLFPTNTVAKVYITPTAAQSVAGVVEILLLGYKIVQGASYQP